MKDIVSPCLLTDGYKIGHIFQYPKGLKKAYSNLTPRGSRVEGVEKMVVFGLSYFIQEFLVDQFRSNFFGLPKDKVIKDYRRRMKTYLQGGETMDLSHIEKLHELGYLPLQIKALPEGSRVPMRVPYLTIQNTHPDFAWLPNALETLMSCVLWKPNTSATTAFEFRLEFERWARRTGADPSFVKWQSHDFSMRGMSGPEDAITSGAAHLLSNYGTDTIPAIDFLEEFYQADSDKEVIGGSVPATEHSVMSMGGVEGEEEIYRRLLTEVYPTGIVSIVSDTYDFFKVLTELLPRLKDVIMGRDGKLVIRPDSGDPVKIVCGDPAWQEIDPSDPRGKGAIQLLWELFGGTVNEKGYKVLDSHIGLIYGDSINRERQTAILEGLAAKGFASSNVVLGVGSYTYQMVTRDTYGQAMKATYGENAGGGFAIFKDPKTDDGVKKSAKGLLCVGADPVTGELTLYEDVSEDLEQRGELKQFFLNGDHTYRQSLSDIRARIDAEIEKELRLEGLV